MLVRLLPVAGSPGPPGTSTGDGTSPPSGAIDSSGGSSDSSLPLIIGVAVGSLVLVLILAGLCWRFVFMGKRRDPKLAEPTRAHSKGKILKTWLLLTKIVDGYIRQILRILLFG
jgi:hypothetical protein